MKKRFIALLVVFVLAIGLFAVIPAYADEAPDSIKIGWVVPLTGPLGNQTIGVQHAIDICTEAMNKDGGIYIAEYDKKIPVEVILGDSESDATKASEVATKLVTNDKVDILVGVYTPDVMNPVSVVGERYQVPTIVGNGPSNSWLSAGPYEWSFALAFNNDQSMDEWFNGFDTLETNKKIALALDSNVDSVLVAGIIADRAANRGYEVVDPGRFPEGTNDFSAILSSMIDGGADIVIAVMATPYEVTFWNQMVQMGYKPKVAVLSKGMHLTVDVLQLGDNAFISADSQWTPYYPFSSSLLGMTAKELCDDFQAAVGQTADHTIGWDYTPFDIIYDAVTRAASLDKTAIRDAIAETDLDCTYGHVTFDDEHVYTTPVFFGQWVSDGNGGLEKHVIDAQYVPELTETVPLEPIPWD